MAEGVGTTPGAASRKSVDSKGDAGDPVSSTEIHCAQVPGDAGPPRELQVQPEYDDETVERVYRKLDLRIIPGESKREPKRAFLHHPC